MTMTSLRFALVLMCTTGFVDAYTYLERGGVFANAQTGNVILGAIGLSDGSYEQALRHLVSVLAFAAGVAIAVRLRFVSSTGWPAVPEVVTLVLYAAALGAVAFVPASAPSLVATVPITLVSGMLFELFRSIGNLSYAPIATTGNLIRWIEAGHAQVSLPDDTTPQTFGAYAAVVTVFVAAALAGALTTDAIGVRAISVPAVAVVLALVAVVRDQRARRTALVANR